VHDCGTLVNPMTLAGHVRGGTAQGIGTALYEQYYYDAEGQLLTANYADYLLPSVHEVPENVRVGHVETPSPYTEYGIKGGGEGGRMGAPPAICSAIEDALRPLGVKVDALPITPRKLRALIRCDAESLTESEDGRRKRSVASSTLTVLGERRTNVEAHRL
jgi:CO/xanthine dehydrogenase Mo-binding subunit